MRSSLLLVPCLLTGALVAQTGSAVNLTVANMNFNQSALSTTSNSYVLGNLSANVTDHLFSSWWFYRLPGDTQEWAFRADAGSTRVVSSPTITTTWPDVRIQGKISAVLVDTLISTGATSGYLKRTMTITNLDAVNPITLDVFAYADFDHGGSTLNNGYGDGQSQYVFRPTFTPGVEFYAADADRHQVSPWQTTTAGALPFVLTNTAVENLSNAWSAMPFVSADYNGAYQWTKTIPASGNAVCTAYLGITANAVASMPVITTYGPSCSGTAGAPVISQNQEAMVTTGGEPRQFKINLTNGPPSAAGLLLQAFNSGDRKSVV